MGSFFNKVLTGFDAVARGLNEAAFGDVRNLFTADFFTELMGRPIGLVYHNYEFVTAHLRRNIGNSLHTYDGYGTPIGELSNPFYNSFTRVPWFFMDGHKNSTSNYLEYMRQVYGASLSVENINEDFDIRIVGEGSNVGVIETSALRDAINSGIPEYISLINPNGGYTDTKLGIDSTHILSKLLGVSMASNDARDSESKIYGITKDLKKYFGLKHDAIVDHNILDVSSHNIGESFLSNGYYNSNLKSPVYNSNYGNIDKIGIYEDYVKSMPEDTLYHFIYNTQLEVNEDGSTQRKIADDYVARDMMLGLQHGRKYLPTKNDNYLAKMGINASPENIKLQKDEYEEYEEDGRMTKKFTTHTEEYQIRYIFKNAENTLTNASQGGVFVYTEADGPNKDSADIQSSSFNSGTKFSNYTSFGSGLSSDDLLKKTNIAFKQGKYNTLMARFKTGVNDGIFDPNDTLQTAISKEFGMSRGRNLLKLEKDSSQGYENPYCRVWTFHHQYHRLADAIRPFQESGENGSVLISQKDLYDKYGFSAFSASHAEKEGFEDGRTRLGKYGVINQHNGLVNITPIDSGDENKKVSIKNCMFSIENLAWKDSFSSKDSERETFQNGGLSSEQKGPFGGRIMWFPPYALKFNETVSVAWNPNSFIGRGEDIYTYKNTTRSGQLSFKLLIDHPSIINYWENKGKSVSNSVDNKDDPEQQLLRFFAGCEMLSSKKAETKKIETVQEDEPQPYPKSEIHTFYVFFPNDYSGVNDDPDYAMDYLTNGIGTWKTKNGDDYKTEYSKASVILNGGSDTDCSGYEMNIYNGISYVKVESSNGLICKVTYGNQKEAEGIYTIKGSEGQEWHYRIDDNRKSEKYVSKDSYIDKYSYGLNSLDGLKSVSEYLPCSDKDKLYSFADAFIALTEGKKSNVRDVIGHLVDNNNILKLNSIFSKKNKINGIICTGQASIQGNSSPESKNAERNKQLASQRAKTVAGFIRKYLSGVSVQTTSISPEGKKDGVSGIENKLHRCVKVEIYVQSEESQTLQDAELRHSYRPKMNPDGTIGSVLSEKVTGRPNYPSMTYGYATDVLDDGTNIYYDDKALKRKSDYMKISTFGKSVDYLTFNLKNSIEDRTLNVNGVYNAIENFIDINSSESDADAALDQFRRVTNSLTGNGGDEGGKGENILKTILGKANPIGERDENYNSVPQESVPIKRYDNESKFFEMLEIEEPFLHHKISDKIKYFDPAFHSVSPEGFNARLTFLQQCTRQGPTCGSSDVYTGDNTANNLAFGRPPVCILRIGDFYYTKILIDSLTVDFGDVMWDLNAEGIGVMPMIADVNISFKYIGGSSLSGPISRLQNALSFNMYANTEVYDNRAELAEYDESGKLIKFGHNPLN
jgi:hypothetical protein